VKRGVAGLPTLSAATVLGALGAVLGALGAVLGALGACGRVAAPVPPEQRAPAPASDLGGVVHAGEVELHWKNPTRRVHGRPLRDLISARVFRADTAHDAAVPSAVLSRGRIPGYAEIATIRMDAPAPATVTDNVVTFVDRSGLVIGRRYTYVIVTADSERRPSPPSPRLTISFVAAPGPPRTLVADPLEGEVRLYWSPPAQMSDGSAPEHLVYEILRGPGTGDGLGPLSANETDEPAFVDRGVQNDQTYRYAVRAVRVVDGTRAIGEASAPVSATPLDMTPPSVPTELVAVLSERMVRLSWRPSPEADVARYVVYRAGATGDFERIGSVAPPGTVFVDRDVGPGRYRYAVSAEDGSSRKNESARSDIATVSVP